MDLTHIPYRGYGRHASNRSYDQTRIKPTRTSTIPHEYGLDFPLVPTERAARMERHK